MNKECSYCGQETLDEDLTPIAWSPINGATARVGYEAEACPDCIFESKELQKGAAAS